MERAENAIEQLIEAYKNKVRENVLTIVYNQQLDQFKFAEAFNLNKLNIMQCNKIQFTHVPLNITELTVSHCQIESIEGIEQMKQLTVLNLNRNNISNILPISSLINLKELHMSYNKIQDISAIKYLTKHKQYNGHIGHKHFNQSIISISQ
ncbi:LPXTG_cell wall anchor domain-containing protein [Hexamita inflata]|uniref:LPXTG cell wall anchor domain-containing protein n=1 Tax=Hexamita inflata TaxID=28002 RepID=A0AA86UP55_9EUKA|nr:LPXTG cell wall anchor domain-containing protein [Hexamita inflata]